MPPSARAPPARPSTAGASRSGGRAPLRPWPSPKSVTFKEDLSEKLGVNPENVHLTVRKSAQGQTAEVKVRVSGLTEGKAAKVVRRAKQAADSGRGLPTPEDVQASQRDKHREELRQQHWEEMPGFSSRQQQRNSGFVSGVRSAVANVTLGERHVRSAAKVRAEVQPRPATTLSGTSRDGGGGMVARGRHFGRGKEPSQEEESSRAMTDSRALGRIRDMVRGALDRDYAITTRRQNLIRAFRVLDGSNSNNLSRAELDRGLTRMGLWLPLAARQQLFAALDKDRDGLVTREDFQRFLFEDGKDGTGLGGGGDGDDNEKLLYDDTTALKLSMKKRRVMGSMGKILQRRFRDYDLGDALLYALHGIMPDDYSGDVSLQKEEFEAILLKAQVPISQEELRWVTRTFTVPDEDDRGFRLNRLEAAPLINFALGVSDPWQETGSLEEILASITPEEMNRLEKKQQRRTGTYGAYARPTSHRKRDHPHRRVGKGGKVSGSFIADYDHSDEEDDTHVYDFDKGDREDRRSRVNRLNEKKNRQSGGDYGDVYDDDDDDDDDAGGGYGSKRENYRATKVASFARRRKGRKTKMNNQFLSRSEHSAESLDNNYGSPRALDRNEDGYRTGGGRSRSRNKSGVEINPLLQFTRPVFGGGKEKKKRDPNEWRNFRNKGGYTADGDEGVDMRYEQYHEPGGGHVSLTPADKRRTIFRANADRMDGLRLEDDDDQDRSHYSDDEYGEEDEEEDEHDENKRRQPPYRGTPAPTQRWKDSAREYEDGDELDLEGSGMRGQRKRPGDGGADRKTDPRLMFAGGSTDFHEVRAAVAFMEGEEAKAAKYLARERARDKAAEGRGFVRGQHPVVRRMINDGDFREETGERDKLPASPRRLIDPTPAPGGSAAEEAEAGGSPGGRRNLRRRDAPAGVTAVPFPEDPDEREAKARQGRDPVTNKPKFFLLKCLVTCPPSLYPGDAFDIAVGDGTYTVTVPRGVNPGQQFTVRVDTREVAATQRSSATAAAAAADAASSRERPVPLGEAVRTGIRGGKANTGIRGLWSVDATEPDENLEGVEDEDERAALEFQKAEMRRKQNREKIAREATTGGPGIGATSSYGPKANTSDSNSGRRHDYGYKNNVGKSSRRKRGAGEGEGEGEFGGNGGEGAPQASMGGLPLSQAPFLSFPRGRTDRGSLEAARAAAVTGMGEGGGGGDRGGRVMGADHDAYRSESGTPQRSRLMTASWEWEVDLLRKQPRRGGGANDGGGGDGEAPPHGARPVFGGGGGGSRRGRSSSPNRTGAATGADYLKSSWDDGRPKGQVGGELGEKELERIVAQRIGVRPPPNPVDPEEYKHFGMRSDRNGNGGGGEEEEEEEEEEEYDPHLDMDFKDNRPLRGNNPTWNGKRPMLPGKWRSRVGASTFGVQPKVRHLTEQVRSLYRNMSKDTERAPVNVRAFFDFVDRDQDGVVGLEDLIMMSMEENVSMAGLQGESDRLPPELITVDQFIQSVKSAAGRSLGSTPGALSLGEMERWLEPVDPTLSALRTKVATQLERQLARDLGTGAVAGGRAGAGQAAANLMRSVMRRVNVEVQEDTYDGAVPIRKVSHPALLKAVRRAELPLSVAEVGLLAEAFRARRPEGTSGAAIRNIDYDAIVRFFTT